MTGQSIFLTVPPEGAASLRETLAALSRGERIEPYETVRIRKDGSRLCVSVTISPIEDADGRVTGAIALARDITPQKLAEDALLRSELRFRQLAENINEVFWVMDVIARQIVYVSPAYRKSGDGPAKVAAWPRGGIRFTPTTGIARKWRSSANSKARPSKPSTVS